MEEQKFDPCTLVPPEFVKIRWERLGRTMSGTDCLGLVWLYCTRVGGLKLPDTDGMPIPTDWKKADAERMVREILKYGDLAPINKLKKFDAVLFTLSDKTRIPDHIGVMVSGTCFMHILENRESEVIKINQFWRDRMVGAVRFGVPRILLPQDFDEPIRM